MNNIYLVQRRFVTPYEEEPGDIITVSIHKTKDGAKKTIDKLIKYLNSSVYDTELFCERDWPEWYHHISYSNASHLRVLERKKEHYNVPEITEYYVEERVLEL